MDALYDLPRLMITNCLDTSHATWTGGYSGTGSTGTNKAGESIHADNQNKAWKDTTAANNCHREANGTNSKGHGWNNVTPW